MYRPHHQGGRSHFLLLKCRLHTVISFQKVQYGKVWGGSIFTVETPHKHYRGLVIKASSIASPGTAFTLDAVRMALYLCGLPPKEP